MRRRVWERGRVDRGPGRSKGMRGMDVWVQMRLKRNKSKKWKKQFSGKKESGVNSVDKMR